VFQAQFVLVVRVDLLVFFSHLGKFRLKHLEIFFMVSLIFPGLDFMLFHHLIEALRRSLLLFGESLLKSMLLAFIEALKLIELVFALTVHFLETVFVVAIFLLHLALESLQLLTMALSGLFKNHGVILVDVLVHVA